MSQVSGQRKKLPTFSFHFLFYFEQRFFIHCFGFFLDFIFYPLNGFFMPIKCVQVFPSHIQHLCLISFLLLCKKVSKFEPVRIYIQILIYCVAFFQLKFHFENNFDKYQLQTHLLHFFLHVSILNFFHQWFATAQFVAHMESMHIGSKQNFVNRLSITISVPLSIDFIKNLITLLVLNMLMRAYHFNKNKITRSFMLIYFI